MKRIRYSKDQLERAIANSESWAAVIRDLGRKHSGGLQSSLIKQAKHLGVDYSHFKGQGHLRGGSPSNKRPLEEYLVENGTLSSLIMKIRLVEEGLKERRCERCGVMEWNEKPAPIVLEHKNGVHNDDRLENLELLCPNCHAQTPFYSRNRQARKVVAPAPDELKNLLKVMSPRAACKHYGVSGSTLWSWVWNYDLVKRPG